MRYEYLGLCLAVFFGCCLFLLLFVDWLKKRKTGCPLYRQRLPKKLNSMLFLSAMEQGYQAAGSIRGMLLILRKKWTKGPESIRIRAAIDYLENSRYKDYETTLSYLTDHTKEFDSILQDLLEREIRRQRGLICRTGGEGTKGDNYEKK